MRSRRDRINSLKENPKVSVLIVGAGINGIGTFRDLALQGIDVVIVDREDYCSGASAASSHMVHGGIRYLENGEFRLVREAVRERNRLIGNAPHLVKPLPTTFPIFRLFSGLLNAPLKFLGLLERPAERGAVVIKIGMMVYDFFTRAQKTVPRHVFLNRRRSLELFPYLNPEIIFTGTYYDGAMPSPERIAIELLCDAAEANSKAIPLNYVWLVSAQNNEVVLEDKLTGERFGLKPQIVVNAAGPWIDLVNFSLGWKTHFIGGTKGSHLILDHPELRKAIGENEFFFENKDGRIVLIFPIKDKVMIGTSDIRVEHPDDVMITDEEIDYFFEMIGRVFPSITVERSEIVYSFSGVRPLQYSPKGAVGQISRNHKVGILEPSSEFAFPVLSLIGGKWTSFRAFSEETANEVLKRLGKSRKVSTAGLKIGGSRGFPGNASEREAFIREAVAGNGLAANLFNELLETYGTKSLAMFQAYGENLADTLTACPEISKGEIQYFLSAEDAVHLDDLILRRTMLGKLGRITLAGLEEIAAAAAEEAQWSEERRREEVSRTLEILRVKHRLEIKNTVTFI